MGARRLPKARPQGLATAGAAAAAGLLSLLLAWQIVAVAQAGRLARDMPAEALKWRPAQALALARLAELRFESGGAVSPGETPEALARRALAAGPLQVRAIRVLAWSAEREGDSRRALALMTIAGARSQRDAASHLWLLRNRLRARDFAAAYAHGDALMRNPAARRRGAAEMALSLGSDGGAQRALVNRLVYNPAWRISLIEQIASVQDPRLLLSMLLELKEKGSIVAEAEAAIVAQRLLSGGEAQQAYLAWVLLLPESGYADLGVVYDGGFEGLPGKGPFAWDFDRKGFAQIMQAPYRDGRALSVSHTDSARAVHAWQTLVLAPGPYQLSVDAFMENAGNGGRLWWRIGCARGSQELATLDAPAKVGAWHTVSTAFLVPDTGCAAQTLELYGSTEVTGNLIRGWFDSLRVQPASGDRDRGGRAHGA